MVLVSPAHVINASLHGKLPYDPVKDFIPVTQVADVPNILTIYPQIRSRIEPTPSAAPRAFAAFLEKETAKWSALVKESGAKVD